MQVLLVNTQELFLDSLQILLEDHGLQIVGTARDGPEALRKARNLYPSLILTDILLPDSGSGLQTIRDLRKILPETWVVVLAESTEYFISAVQSGACGYLLKSISGEELVVKLNSLKQGDIPLAAGLTELLLQEIIKNQMGASPRFRDYKKEKLNNQLTYRQKQVLEMIAQGQTYREIGKGLHLSERTIKYHVKAIMQSLHLKNKTQLMAWVGDIMTLEAGPGHGKGGE